MHRAQQIFAFASEAVVPTAQRNRRLAQPTLQGSFFHFIVAVFLILGGASAVFSEDTPPSFLDQLQGKVPASITGNPAAENDLPGTGAVGPILHLPEKFGVRLGGVWLGDSNWLLSGGLQPGKWSFNSALIVGANLDAETLIGWKGASFGIQFLQFNGQDANGQAGSVQGYNSLPGPEPLNRSELYQLWYRQTLFEDWLIFRMLGHGGKSSYGV